MRISKSLLLTCVVVFCVSLAVRADDNAAQAAARAALMEKMQELNSGQSNNPAPPPPPMARAPAPEMTPPVATPPPAPAPENQVPPVTTPPAPAMTAPQPEPETTVPVPENSAPVANQSNFSAPSQTTTGDNAAQSAARAALLAQEMELANGQPTNPPAPVMVPPMAMTNSVNPSAPQPTTMPAPAEKRGFFSRIFHPFHHSAVAEERPMKSVVSAYSGKNSGFTPIVPPPAPVSPEKDAKLQALLEKYKADQITPEQYQAERAEILSSP